MVMTTALLFYNNERVCNSDLSGTSNIITLFGAKTFPCLSIYDLAPMLEVVIVSNAGPHQCYHVVMLCFDIN